uniref:Dymeclin n=1 Tax=Panagrolaimus superbus TaxID=310955 RepID=A0A914YJ56_9BILA
MFEESVSEDILFLKFLMSMKSKANEFMKSLMTNIIEHRKQLPREIKEEQAESIVLSIASSLWSSFARSVSIDTPPEQSENELGFEIYPTQTLAALSNSLILTLVCYNKFCDEINVYKLALEKCQNSQEVSSLVNPDVSFRIDFSELYLIFCESATEPLSMLLLYMLIHRNMGFKNFVLARINIENLVTLSFVEQLQYTIF